MPRQSRWRVAVLVGLSACHPTLRPPAGIEPSPTTLLEATVGDDAPTVERLLASGAPVDVRDAAGHTALLLSVADPAKVRLLLGRAAAPDVAAETGYTPLMVVVNTDGSGDVVRALLGRGASAHTANKRHFDVLMWGAHGGDPDVVRALLDAGADAKAKNDLGFTPLHSACVLGRAETVRMILDAGAPVDVAETVQHRTPLHWCVAAGSVEAARLLVDRGASVGAVESFGGTTPLIVAAASERHAAELVSLLVEHGADVNARDHEGRSALDWALRRGDSETAALLRRRGAVEQAPPAPSPNPSPAAGARATIERALPALAKAGPAFVAASVEGCVSCHHQTLPMMALAAAREHHYPVDEPALAAGAREILRVEGDRRPRLLEGIGVPDPFDAMYLLYALVAVGQPRDGTTDALAHYLALKQAADGHWAMPFHRPPIESSSITGTALALRDLQVYLPPGRRVERDQRVARACAWLEMQSASSTEERVFRLLGLRWCGGAIDGAARDLLATQRPDGGWSQLDTLTSDAYATGEALVALRTAGLPPRDAALQRGAQFLVARQLADGTWYVPTRALPVQSYFESGFPHGRSQFISVAATAWATLALVLVGD